MNLMEGNHHTKEKDWREDLRSDLNGEQMMHEESDKEDDFPIEDLDQETDNADGEGIQEFLRKPYMTTVLLGVILVLLICIIVMLLLMPNSGREAQTSDLQQSIAQYA